MKTHILFITFTILSITSFAQNKANDIPLFLFLQKNADSTIAIEYVSNWIQKPSLQIISKKEDTVSIYTYADKRKFEESGNMPKKIRDSIYVKNRLNIFSTPIDVNIYFNSIYKNKDSLSFFWRELTELKPWELKDDMKDGEGCKLNNNGIQDQNIYDGGGIKLYLITKGKIENLYFYSPDFYENLCPGRIGTQSILKIVKLFSTYLN